eukprot:6212016-Pleurochrysis_carterae.AAC.2
MVSSSNPRTQVQEDRRQGQAAGRGDELGQPLVKQSALIQNTASEPCTDKIKGDNMDKEDTQQARTLSECESEMKMRCRHVT